MPSFPRLRGLILFPALPLLAGCNAVLLSPSGDVAVQQRNLILISTGLMLLIIVPVIILTLLFAWRYRASNQAARYDPEWNHSTVLELLIWAAPLLIIIALGALTWVSTHQLDPYRPLARLSEGREVPPDTKPLVVEVVALDWKWLFVYPEQGVAAVNEMAAPVDRPIQFRITSSSVMNSFFIPALAGQIYAMPGMQTTLHAVINHPGEYEACRPTTAARASPACASSSMAWITRASKNGWPTRARRAPRSAATPISSWSSPASAIPCSVMPPWRPACSRRS